MSLQRQLLTILFFFLSGFFLFKAGFLTIQHFVVVPSSQPLYAYAQENVTSPLPSQLIIPDRHINLPILPSTQLNGEWQVTTQGVSLITPEQRGDTHGYVIYGHDWPVLLGKMRQASIGQHVTLKYGNGQEQTYKITSIFKVAPTHSEILKMAKEDTLVIYTCDGFMDSQRLVVIAQLQ